MSLRFAELVETSDAVAATRKRGEKIARLADLLGRLAPAEVPIAVAYLAGELRQGKIGVGHALARDALGATAPAELDSGDGLGLAEVDAIFSRIAAISGKGSAAARGELLRGLMARGSEAERHFLLRLLVGELRQGALEAVTAEAVARAAGVPAGDVRRALMLAGDLRAVAEAALLEGAAGLERFGVELMRPLQPMLASPADSLAEAFDKLDADAAVELKLDGARVQVHKDGDEVRIFSRRLNDVTAAVPEIVAAARALPARQAILDGEVLALGDGGRPHPFQVTMRRFGRRLDVEEMRRKLPLVPYFFDLLYLDGGDLLDRPQRERSAALAALLPEAVLIPGLVTADAAAAETFFADAIERGHEGVMVKALDAPYAAGSRGVGWLKVKPAHTLDLVVLAAEWGSGRRRGWLSNLHLGARDTERGGFVMLGKTFKGLTDKLLAWQTEALLAREIGRDRHVVHVRPELVVEIAFNDLQASPRYPGGLALRFARVKRYRDDKGPEQADTFDTVRALYAQRTGLEPPTRK